jgi:hypothetical protein
MKECTLYSIQSIIYDIYNTCTKVAAKPKNTQAMNMAT